MSVIAGVDGVLGPFGYPQHEVTDAFAAVVAPDGGSREVIKRIHAATGVEHRYLALPLDEYDQVTGFGEANDAFIRVGLDLVEAAAAGALEAAGLVASDVDMVMMTTVTGIAVPSVEARLVPRLGLRPDVKRLPVFGLGCVAGAAGVARVHDYLVGHPADVVLLLCLELCSLTVQKNDTSMANIVASGLFGDGAAAVVMVGEDRARQLGIRGPEVLASRSRMYPDTERTMGWDIGGSGFRIVLSPGVPDLIMDNLGGDVAAFLDDHALTTSDIATWVSHPGGPKVLQAMESSLDLHDGQLDVTWRSLAAIGNLSSASVLHVLGDTLAGRGVEPPVAGTPGMLMAMGPGFCAELVLLRW
ncbi:MAG: type III polyketide synthase [Actinomycetales bacterium]|nr:type III polyketide synthase [Actinomycetales bacterium]